MPYAGRRLLPGFSHRISQSLRHPRGKPLAGAQAWPWFALVRSPPASLRGPPNIAIPPMVAPLPERISRSKVCGTCPADTALLRAAESPGWVSPSPVATAVHLPKFAPFCLSSPSTLKGIGDFELALHVLL